MTCCIHKLHIHTYVHSATAVFRTLVCNPEEMAEAPPPKKRKLDGPWFRDCLQEFDETVKTNVATKLDKFSEKDLYTATFDALMSLLKSAISDENLREQVALRLHNNLRKANTPAPAP